MCSDPSLPLYMPREKCTETSLGAQMLEFAVGGTLSEPGKSHHLRVCVVWVQIPKHKGHFFFLLEYYVKYMSDASRSILS